MDKGVFITVEGADGSGKTTQMEFLQQWLIEKNINVVLTREPGGTKLGEILRDILLGSKNTDSEFELSNDTELLLMFAARMQHLQQVIIPAIEQGKWVLCDRFTDASYAYQGGGRGIDTERIRSLEDWVQQGLQPDLTLMFDIPVAIGLERTKSRGGTADRFEQQQIEFKESVRKAYLQRANDDPSRIKVIDGTESILVVQEQLVKCLRALV